MMAVLHADADAYYASAECARYKRLLGRPIGVLGNQGACVIARNYEMREFGITVGEPIWEAKRKCPDGVFVQRDFRWYETLCLAMFELLKKRYPVVQFYSIDEFFALVPECHFQAEAEALRALIWKEIGVPVTVGIGRSKGLAKLISDSSKPRGALAVVDPAEEERFLDRPVTDITGIAERRAYRLSLYGIKTCLDFRRANRALIRQVLTCTGESLWWEMNGDPVDKVLPKRPEHKTISRGGSFGPETNDPDVIYAWMVRNLERLIPELRYHGVRTGRVALIVEHANGRAGIARTSLASPSARLDTLLESLRPCLKLAWKRPLAANRMHVIAERLTPKPQAQLSLFDPPEADRLGDVKQAINDAKGRHTIRSGATLYLPEIYDSLLHEYDVCDVRGKSCF